MYKAITIYLSVYICRTAIKMHSNQVQRTVISYLLADTFTYWYFHRVFAG